MKLALIGAGERGTIYADHAVGKGHQIVAVADLRAEKRLRAAKRYGISPENCYEEGLELIQSAPEADAAIVATMDRGHFAHAMAALDRGWNLLLEKPISPDPGECVALERKAREKGLGVTVCHVLRYTPFFQTVKHILDEGTLGRVVTIDHTENVGNFHMAHSFVRGNWRNSDLASPMILQKSCHDLDLLLWLTGKHARQVFSTGTLSFFRPENAPEGSADRCLDCPVAGNCRFDARKAYLPGAGDWPSQVLTEDQSEAGILRALREGPYGRCVFRCDNNVCDHQSTAIAFEDGVTAVFTLSGMTDRIYRYIHIMCEHGELFGDEGRGVIRINGFRSNGVDASEERVIRLGDVVGGHSGGDAGLMDAFLDALERGNTRTTLSAISDSVESHLLAFAAEQSRLTGQAVAMDAYRAMQ